MSDGTSAIEPLTLSVGSFTYDGFAAGPPEGTLVLMLHGWPQFADSWREIAGALAAEGYRAVALDQRGYSPGARPEAIEAYALDRLVADVLGFIDALGARRVHLVTHDWGAIVGWQFAAEHPERLLSFTALAVPHMAALREALANDTDQQKRSAYVTMFRLPGGVAERALLSDDAAALHAAYQGKVAPEQAAENVRRLSEPGALTATLNWYRANAFDVSPPAVTVPTLYIWASRDRALGERAARNTAQFVSGPYRFVEIDASHWIADECPQDVLAALRPHLAAHDAAPKG